MKIILASNNAHKLEEIKAKLPNSFDLVTLNDVGITEDIPETGNTFEANALQKAQFVASRVNGFVLADDSGLEVDALGGQPGVFSARYSGEHGNHQANNAKLLRELKGVNNRSARFRTVLCLLQGDKVHYFEGIVEGIIAVQETGSKGFGYDPLFVPKGYSTSFAEMTLEAKNAISHRALALEKLIAFLTY